MSEEQSGLKERLTPVLHWAGQRQCSYVSLCMCDANGRCSACSVLWLCTHDESPLTSHDSRVTTHESRLTSHA